MASSSFDGVPDEIEYVELISAPDGGRYFRVIAYNAAGASADSSTVCAAPPGAAPC